MRKTVTAVAACAVSVMTCAGVREQFADPPPESRLQAWYHWTTTGITDECLAADLKAMGELGVGTAHVFMPGQQGLPPVSGVTAFCGTVVSILIAGRRRFGSVLEKLHRHFYRKVGRNEDCRWICYYLF